MRNTAIALNSIVVVFFACFLGYTFFARQHLDGLAREFVTQRTLRYSAPIVEMADHSLDSPLVQKAILKGLPPPGPCEKMDRVGDDALV